jgi:hypothetical protein
VTDEDPSIVDPWVKRAKPGYPMAILEPDSLESVLKVDGFPCEAVIDTDGRIAYSDGFGRTGSGGALSDALKKATKAPLWTKKFSKVADLIATGQLDKSWAELTKLQAGEAELAADEQAAATKLKAYLEGAAVEAQAQARTLLDTGFVLNAQKRVEMFAKANPPFPATAECAKLLAEIEAVPGYKAEIKAGEQFLAAESLERENKFSEAFKAYKAIVKGAADTKLAANAKAAAERLIDDGMPGFSPSCQECRKAQSACEKHAEKLKL